MLRDVYNIKIHANISCGFVKEANWLAHTVKVLYVIGKSTRFTKP